MFATLGRFLLINFFSLLFLFFPTAAFGQEKHPLAVINEIAWMGTADSYAREWIELYNNSNKPLNLDNWLLAAGDGDPRINLSGKIPAKGFYLLERTNDQTAPKVKADLIYKGGLSNKGEDLKIYDGAGNLIDQVDCSAGWFSGDNQTKQTMSRIDPLRPGNDPQNWQTSQNPGGTPGKENDGIGEKNEINPYQSIKTAAYPTGIIINEILPSPKGPDADNEWIEIKNRNNFPVNLSGWKIRDKKGKITVYAFSPTEKIAPQGFLILKRPKTKITLNNKGDGLEIINPDDIIVDSASFGKTFFNQSFNRFASTDNWSWSAVLTPGAENIISPPNQDPETKKEKIKIPALPNLSPPTLNQETASVKEKIPKTAKNSLNLTISFVAAVSSAFLILFLKKSLKNKI
jgi:hypothetical protein